MGVGVYILIFLALVAVYIIQRIIVRKGGQAIDNAIASHKNKKSENKEEKLSDKYK